MHIRHAFHHLYSIHNNQHPAQTNEKIERINLELSLSELFFILHQRRPFGEPSTKD
jgi:hypothetical protein